MELLYLIFFICAVQCQQSWPYPLAMVVFCLLFISFPPLSPKLTDQMCSMPVNVHHTRTPLCEMAAGVDVWFWLWIQGPS